MQRPSIYTRPADKPRSMVVPRGGENTPVIEKLATSEPLMVDKGTECHVTPEGVAVNMFYHLDLRAGHKFLEPSAGTGNIILAMADRGHDCANITAVERHCGLCDAMRARFVAKQEEYSAMEYDKINLINECFLEWSAQTGESFDRIAMNPPFKAVRAHMAAAEGLLKPGGVLVALVPITFKHDHAIVLEELPNDTFLTAKVWTKLIRIEKDF